MRDTILSAGLADQIFLNIKKRYAPRGIEVRGGLSCDQIVDQLRGPAPRLLLFAVKGTAYDAGLDVIRRIRAMPSQLPILLITRYSSEKRAIAALRAGVRDYYKTPVPLGRLFKSIDTILDGDALQKIAPAVREDTGCSGSKFIGSSACMQSIKRYLAKLADSPTTVLITGETGTGKELAADFIHCHSARAQRPMVTVNCAALPESLTESELFGYERGAFTGATARQPGKFVQASGGTIFLDEIGEMRPMIQAKILHAIERKIVYPLGAEKPLPVDTRIIAATNQELEHLMVDGRFREDLYYRLNIARVNLPPLREHKEDIPELISYGVRRLNTVFGRHVKGMACQAMDQLLDYAWPGNVRELMNLLEAAFVNLPRRQTDFVDLPDHFKNSLRRSRHQPANERRYIVDALMRTNWNKSNTAKKLNWSRMTLYRKMAHHKIIENRSLAAQPD